MYIWKEDCILIPGYMTIKEASEKWGLGNRWVNSMCQDGRIPGAQKFGNAWAIPADMEKPSYDRRIKNGKYKDWRKKYGKNKVINNK